jgi:hypothetical protein
MLTLSHWPNSPTPRAFVADLSTESAFRYIESRHRDAADAVTCDHPDIDGLCSLYALVDPIGAYSRKADVIALARAGDFGVVNSRRVAMMAFVLGALLDPSRSPYAGETAPRGNEWTAHCYREALKEIAQVIDHVEDYEELSENELARYDASLRSVAEGRCTIETDPTANLIIVRASGGLDGAGNDEGRVVMPVHPFVIHSAHDYPRVFVSHDGGCFYYDRYESWVRVVTRDVPKRRDLTRCAEELARLDPDAQWSADPPNRIEPMLSAEKQSALEHDVVLACVREHLINAPVGFDPFAKR